MMEMMRVMNAPKSHHKETVDTSTCLLEEEGEEEPFFKDLHASDATRDVLKSFVGSKWETTPPPPAFVQPNGNRYYETFKNLETPAKQSYDGFYRPRNAQLESFERERRYPYM